MSADDVVRLWREANSLERDADFAFFWDHKHEAIAEAGQLIADAWEFCRRRVSQGLGSVVKDLLALEEAPLLLAPAEPKSVPSAAVPTQLAKKTTKPSQAARFRPTFEAVEAPKEPFVELLLEIAREASSLAVGVGETRSDLVDAMRPKMLQLVQATELPTLRRVKDTWRDLANWCDESGLNTGKLSPSQLSRFYQESTSPSRVLPALKWLAKNLTINWELSLCVGRSTQAKGRHGVGARQAPTAEPLMFATLQDSLEAALSHGTDVLPALVTMWLVVMGCVRLGHVRDQNGCESPHTACTLFVGVANKKANGKASNGLVLDLLHIPKWTLGNGLSMNGLRIQQDHHQPSDLTQLHVGSFQPRL